MGSSSTGRAGGRAESPDWVAGRAGESVRAEGVE